ncbi:hypothetical protein BC332_32296 [Capsicum chinense]|nr:hypothetical protein BC332_32296 [Capsicum chinense]
MMDSMDPFGNSKKSMEKMVEANQGIETSSILEVGLSSKSDNSSSLMDSMNPYEDFKKSMEEILKANQQINDCEKCLGELLIWYLKSKGKNSHRYIIEAFFDLLNSYISSTNTKSCSHSFTNSPFFGSTSSVSASPFWYLLEAEDEIVDEITTTRRFSL